MTQGTIDLIVEWFGHIQQIATDKKTLTGAVMDKQHCLDEIAAMASRCKQFVEKYQYEQEPINEKELDKLANDYVGNYGCEHYDDGVEAYKAGYHKAKES